MINNHSTDRVLVTGGAGCIGSELALALLAQGRPVTVVDNLSSGKLEHLSECFRYPAFRFVEGDLLDPLTLADGLQDVGFVYHLAANPDVKYVDGDPTDRDLKQNIQVTYLLLEEMRRRSIKKLAFSSTSAIYGIAETLPISENSPLPQPISLYGATKLSCEAMISAFSHLFGIQCWVFRFANIVGAKVRAKGRTVISDFIANLQHDPTQLLILGDGRQAKSYLLSNECVEAMLFAVAQAKEQFNVFNLGGDDWLPVQTIAEMVVSALELENVTFHYTGGEGGWKGDVPRFILDVSRINGLGWRARHTSREAVSTAIKLILQSQERVPQECV